MKVRVHIFGPTGSGKTTLAKALASKLSLQHFDTDDYFWVKTSPPFQESRPLDVRQSMLLKDFRENSSWVSSGTLFGWVDVAIPLFTHVVFLRLNSDIRMERLRRRQVERYGKAALEPDGEHYEADKEFMEWAQSYDIDPTVEQSIFNHEKLLSTLPCPVIELDTQHSVEALVARVVGEISHHQSSSL